MIKLALTDLDDTLVRFGDQHANQRSIDAIRRAMDSGVRFGPVTGRPTAYLGWMFGPGNEDCWRTGAFSNGQVIYLDGKLIRQEELPREALGRLVGMLEATDDFYVAIYDLDRVDGMHFVTSRPDALRANPPATYRLDSDIIPALPAGPVVKANIQCACSRERMIQMRDLVNAEIPELDLVFPSMTATVIDVSPAGWDKGCAVRALAEVMGIGLDEVAVFGDSQNDLAMIESVPNSVAVANACPEVAAAARWHIGACADDAVADALLDIARAAEFGSLPTFMRA